MATSQSADIRALLGGGTDEDRLAVLHFLAGAGFLVLGGILSFFSLLSLRFTNQSPISFGRIELMANTALIIGFGVVTLAGGIYYVLPRLTGARLAQRRLAGLGLVGMVGLTLLGMLSIFLGLSDGGQPLGLPWWLDLPMAAVVGIPALVTLGSLRSRVEHRSYVTIWFVIGGALWLPLLYLSSTIASLPFFSSVTQAFAGTFFSGGFVTMWLLTVGVGLFYYTVVKELDIPLASRQLASVGFWSLGFAAMWWGASQLIFGPGPDWLDGIAAALGLAFPIGAIANAANISLTVEKSWGSLDDAPGLVSGIVGTYSAVVIGVLAALAGFPSIAAAAALTTYWEGIEYAALLGMGPLLVAGVVFPALPRISGRQIPNLGLVTRFNKMTVVGAGGVLVALVAAGLYRGYSWIGGSNGAAYVDVGEGWATGGIADTLILVAVLFGAISLLGQIAYAGVVFGTVTTGKPVAQEVLVTRGGDHE